MNQTEFLTQLKTLLPEFTFNVGGVGTIHGVKSVPIRAFRDSGDKSTVHILGSRKIFISGEMHPNTDKDFIYCTIYTLSRQRGYHCKNWSGYEHKKLFISAKNYDLLLEKLKEQVVEIIN